MMASPILPQRTGGYGYYVAVLLNSGTGTFSGPTNYPISTSPHFVVAGDFNRDGKPDLATANESSNNVSILLNSGTGTFSVSSTTYNVGSSPRVIVTGDFNSDGNNDLATVNYLSNDVSVLLGDGTGAFGTSTSYAVGLIPI